MATPRLIVDGYHPKCPICQGDPKTCKHSLHQMDVRLWENWIRKIVRDEISKHNNS